MDVDWITVAAQIANFLVLVWLLKRFLYGPVILAMDERDARIAGELREGPAEIRDRRTGGQPPTGRCKRRWKKTVKNDSRKCGRKRKPSANLYRQHPGRRWPPQRAEWMQSLSDEKADFLDDVRQRAAQAFSSMARKALP